MASPVSTALSKGQWRTVVEIVKNDREKAKMWAGQPGPMGGRNCTHRIDTNIHGLPIHEAVNLGAPYEVIDILARAYPDGLARKEMVIKRFPLHIATRRTPLDERVILMLIKYYKQAVDEPDKTGKTPLHYAFMYRASPAVIKAMLEARPNVAKAQDKQGFTPLHLACRYGYPTTCIHALLELNPNAAIMTTGEGQSPLQYIQQANPPNLEEARHLLRRYALKANSQFKTAVAPSSRRLIV